MSMYTIASYCSMIADPNRVEPYTRALHAVIKPGDVVFDIGAGTGLFSFTALEAGAARVYAIEPDQSLELAREEAESRGLADRIVFVREASTSYEPPERADVITFDLRGNLPVFPGNVAATLDAARRFLKPGGVMVPRRDTVFAALLESPEAYRKIDPWAEQDEKPWRSSVRVNANATYRVDVKSADCLLTTPVAWHTIDYGTTHNDSVRNTVRASVGRAGVAHGMILWFDADLADGIGFSTAPGRCGPVYGQMFLPFNEPARVEAGDELECVIHADAQGNTFVWSWRTRVTRIGEPIHDFDQTTFNAWGIDVSELKDVKKKNTNTPAVRLEERFEKSDQLLSCEVAGETVLLSLIDNEYFGLDEVGTYIWRQISPAATVADVSASVTRRFDVD